jgi:hypothetical protein
MTVDRCQWLLQNATSRPESTKLKCLKVSEVRAPQTIIATGRGLAEVADVTAQQMRLAPYEGTFLASVMVTAVVGMVSDAHESSILAEVLGLASLFLPRNRLALLEPYSINLPSPATHFPLCCSGP